MGLSLPEPHHVEPKPASRHAGVLIVESDPDLQWRLARMLTIRGYRVVGASSADGARALVAQWPVDFVLIAERLPGSSGLELTRELRKLHPGVRVLLLTDRSDPVARRRALAAGAMDLLSKPYRGGRVRERP